MNWIHVQMFIHLPVNVVDRCAIAFFFFFFFYLMDDKMKNKLATKTHSTLLLKRSVVQGKWVKSLVFQHNQFWWSRCEGFDVIFMGMNMKCWESISESECVGVKWGILRRGLLACASLIGVAMEMLMFCLSQLMRGVLMYAIQRLWHNITCKSFLFVHMSAVWETTHANINTSM